MHMGVQRARGESRARVKPSQSLSLHTRWPLSGYEVLAGLASTVITRILMARFACVGSTNPALCIPTAVTSPSPSTQADTWRTARRADSTGGRSIPGREGSSRGSTGRRSSSPCRAPLSCSLVFRPFTAAAAFCASSKVVAVTGSMSSRTLSKMGVVALLKVKPTYRPSSLPYARPKKSRLATPAARVARRHPHP